MTTDKRKNLNELLEATQLSDKTPHIPMIEVLKQILKEELEAQRKDMPDMSELEETIFVTGFLAGMNALILRCMPTTTERPN